MTDYEVNLFSEPLLEFAHGQRLQDPHDGLSLFGPCDFDTATQPKKIRYGLIGTDQGVSLFKKWADKMNGPIFSSENNSRIWPPFPGFEAAFHSELAKEPSWEYGLDKNELIKDASNNNPYQRSFDVVNRYLEGIEIAAKKRDDKVEVVICVVPDEVYKSCKPKSYIINGWGRKPTRKEINQFQRGQRTLFSERSNKMYDLSVDFRRQLKAQVMQYNLPVQIVRESTLKPEIEGEWRRGLTCESDLAWNLSTALYYKAGGKPWKLSSARDGVCYIGIAFKNTGQGENSKTATCAAQMFLNSGEGIVFLGDEGPWYSTVNQQYHLNKESAKKLLKGILETYKALDGKDLTEIFIHSRSEVNREEIEGYLEACPVNSKLTIIRVKMERDGIRLFREGKMPILRGTFLKQNFKTGFLWGSGFKPRLNTYDGWEVPVPLRIDILYGDSSIEQVSKDIFGLTKLNYNACKIGDVEPVTVKFSDAVGEILISNKAIGKTDPRFKFYI
ncbi:hypothetical protein COU60_03590 [Candidatus Pacearchaeota archaeon CG10_big_fil_rev_8_21_14_0_10_34_76]|nr:MAG: hypothetical protein COU60_03590 [Candidatus Pacearchaeota archaeon CG10_big_fil_rev_8_21_14_0_10_34_76]